MAKHLIVMHGRSIKPAEAQMERLIRKAVALGLDRAGDSRTADKIRTNDLKLSFAYYGDINNVIQAREEKSDRKALKATDPDHGGQPAFPHSLLEKAMGLTLEKSPKFTKKTYKKVLRDADDSRLLDDVASLVSFFGAMLTFGALNEKIIESAKPDMGEYLMSHKVGSAIRKRLQKHLIPAIEAGDDVMLITHSMGCMVAYDVFWKLSHESEYQDVRKKNNPVAKWVTIGCPLAEPGVRKNLRDGHRRNDDKYPRNAFVDWKNIWAQDDFISHKSSMSKNFRQMKQNNYTGSIKDKRIYNCWIYSDSSSGKLISNPHDLYGYLINRNVGAEISAWAQS